MSEALVTRRRVLQGAGIAGTAGLLALAPTPAFASSDDDGEKDSIVGTWRSTVSDPDLPSFGLLASYSPGGTVIASASIDLQPQFLSTPSFGVWKRTDEGRFAVKFEFFTFDTAGTPSGSGLLRGTVAVDADHIHGPFTLKIFDTTGKTIFTSSGSTTGRRVEVD
jgi:hypothetical protein